MRSHTSLTGGWRGRPAEDRLERIERILREIYVVECGATLRQEERRKARQVDAMLLEIEAAMSRLSSRVPLVLLDAAAGKAYVALLAAKLLLEGTVRQAAVVSIERDEGRVERSRLALARLGVRVPVECRHGDVADPSTWPSEPSIVVALHACGGAADAVIDCAIRVSAKFLLLVPCCTGRSVSAVVEADQVADEISIARHAPVRRRFVQAWVDSKRTLELEAAGYETEVVEFVPPTLTPHNLLWRSRRVREPGRMTRAHRALDRLGSRP